MTRIERILASARVILADKYKERYTDEDLLLLLDEGHSDLCRQAQILHGRAVVALNPDTPYFDLPEDCWMLTRIKYDEHTIPFITHRELDRRYGDSWESLEGTPEAIVYDRRNPEEGKVFPIPSSDLFEEYTLSSDFGVATSLGDSVYGVTVGGTTSNSQLGVLTSFFGEAPSIYCYYIKNPDQLMDVNSSLQTPLMFDTALKYYVVGHAFLIDIDTEYQAKGLQQLRFYERELAIADETENRNATRGALYSTEYRRGV